MKIDMVLEKSKSGLLFYRGKSLVGTIDVSFTIFLNKKGDPSKYLKASYWDDFTRTYVDVAEHFKMMDFSTMTFELNVEQLSSIEPEVELTIEDRLDALEDKMDEILRLLKEKNNV